MKRMIALDWGTSSLRGYLLEDGKILEQRQSPHGIQNLPEPAGVHGFEIALDQICGDWRSRDPDCLVLACGMVGSAQGWREAAYMRCPTFLDDLAMHMCEISLQDGGRLLIVPGILLDDLQSAPDVIRGEETQIVGALFNRPDWYAKSRILLPGTHSKWVEMKDGRVERFATYMTGEIFSILCGHSILGRLMPDEGAVGAQAKEAFDLGVRVAKTGNAGDLAHQLFSVRTNGLTERLPSASLQDYLSGLLIGSELKSAICKFKGNQDKTLVMIGEGPLCDLYHRALGQYDVECTAQFENTSYLGLWQIGDFFKRNCYSR